MLLSGLLFVPSIRMVVSPNIITPGLVLLSKQDYAGAESALREYMGSAPDIEDFDELIATLEELQARLHPAP